MKRFFFSLTALTAVLVGCTQSAVLETPDLENIEISFNPYTGRTPVTKATEIASPSALGAAGGFNLYGTSTTLNGTTTTTKVYINDKHVNYSSGSWAYDQGTAVYWPPRTSTTTLSMAAYSANAYLGADKTASTEDDPSFTWLESTNKKAFKFEVPVLIGNQIDLLATSFQGDLSLNNTEKVDNGKVTLVFHHLLSRIGFQLKTIGPARKVVIKSLSLSGRMYTEGILDLTAAKESEVPTLTQTTPQNVTEIAKKDATYYYITSTSPVTFESGASDETSISSGNYLMIMPHAIQPGDDHYINVTYTIGGSSDKTSRIKLPEGFEFLPGKAYEFILELSTSAITFDVKVEETGWDEPNEENTITRPVTPTTPEGITLLGATATTNSATFALIVNKTGFDEVGVACRAFESDIEWKDATLIAKTSATSKGTYEVIVNSLSPNTTYEYCAYSKTGDECTYYSDLCPKFTTYASVTLNTIAEEHRTFDGAVVSATCNQTMDEYGFCWVKGTKTPTIADTKSTATATAGKFNYTITGLESYTYYTVCAYAKNSATGIVSYSTPQTFRTKFSVSDADYTGAEVE